MACNQPATGARTSQYYVEEVDCGVTPPTPAWQPLRYTAGVPQLTKDSVQSQELDGSREVADIRLGQNQAAAEFAIELSYGSYDDWLEAALGGTWAAGTTESGIDLTMDDVAKTITRVAGDFTTNISVGDFVKWPDFTNAENQGPFYVTSVSPLVVTIANASDLVAENVASGEYTTGDKLEVGTARKTFSILTHFEDAANGLGEYHITRGVEMAAYAFNVAVNAIVTGTFSTIGRSYEPNIALPAGSTFPTVPKTQPYAGVDGRIIEAGVTLAYVTTSDNNLDNEAAAQFEIGSDNISFIEQGRANSTLSLATFFESSTLLSKFINGTESSVIISLDGPDGLLSFSYPRVVYTSGAPDVSGPGSITATVDAQALGGTSGESSIVIQRIAA